jgi:transposase InsO family protein
MLGALAGSLSDRQGLDRRERWQVTERETSPESTCPADLLSTEQLALLRVLAAGAGAVASVASTGDSYDSALVEAFNSLFKAELVRNKGQWKDLDDLEIAVAEYVDRSNHRRLHGETGFVPPVEFEVEHDRHNPAPTTVSASVQSLH